MQSKFDYFCFTFKPERAGETMESCFTVLRDRLFLGDLIDRMTNKGKCRFYDYRLNYENVNLKVPKRDEIYSQGFSFELSSKGFDYFCAYLRSYGLTFKTWLGGFRSLVFEGFHAAPTRVDYAMDDIAVDGEEPVLTMQKISSCIRRNEVVKKARVIDDISSRKRYKSVDGEMIKGSTLYFGSKNSECFVRFYDKRAEKLQKREELPDNCTSWVRFETVFKDSKAFGVVNAFLDMSEDEFNNYMCGVVNNCVRFVSRTSENVSRCPVKRWWSAFLKGCTECFKLPHTAPVRSALARAKRGLAQYVPTIYTMINALGADKFLDFINEEVQKRLDRNRPVFKEELFNNIQDNVCDYESYNAFTQYQYNQLASASVLVGKICVQRYNFLDHCYQIFYKDKFKEQHQNFMCGQGDLLNDL